MKKRHILILLFSLLLTSLFTLFLSISASAADSGNPIRVGWFPYPKSSETNDGKYSGYSYDYLMEIAKYTNWEYEFVEADFATCTEMLKNGELDLICGLQKTAEREEIYDYPELPYGQTYAVLYTDSKSSLQPYDFEHFDGINIGVLKNTTLNESITGFAKNNGFSYNLSEFSTSEELNTALSQGDIDAAALVSFVGSENTRIIARFSPISVYVVTTKGNSDVLVELNRALNYIKINRIYFESELYQKHYVESESLELTDEEQAIVDSSQENPIIVGVVDSCAPISYWNVKTNTYEGLAIEIFNTICKKTGLKVEYVPVDMSRSNEATTPIENSPQLVLGIPLVDGVYDGRGWYLSNSLLQAPLAIVCKYESNLTSEEGTGTIAVVKDFMMARTYIEEKFPNVTIINYATLEDCLTAVSNGTADATVYYESCILYYQQKPFYNDLKLVPADMTGTSLCVAVFTKESQSLLHIVDKGMNRISDNELSALTLNGTMLHTYPLTISDSIYKYRAPLMIIVLLLSTVTIILIALYSIRKKTSMKLAIAYKQKEEALAVAQKASAAKGNFMSRMSHEIRTPLNAVIGYNTIARNELTEAKNDEERKQSEMKVMDCLSKSDIASRHLLTIINDVLDMSAIESGKIKVVNERFDFRGLISSLTAIFYSQAKAKGVDFEVQFDTQMDEWIVGDQMRTNQVLTNLLSNAIKFTPDGGKVTLFIHPQTSDDSIQVHFEVKDTGIGMTDEYMSRIWVPFEQADSSISRRFGGTGLGLSITKTLVDLLAGTITVKSSPGEGSTFYVDLTFTRTEQPEEKGIYDFSSINALIVDDDVSTCDYIRLLLSRSGVRNSAVYSGEDAINAVKTAVESQNPYTICLIDWRMPKMDGLETIKQIRRIVGEELPIIVITAYDFTEVADKAAELGIHRFISKPLFQSSVFNLLATISGSPVPRDNEKPSSYDFTGAKIILAEDNILNMEIARKFLTKAKFTVESAWNGQEAVNLFFSAPPGTYDAILMDVQMPVMDGYQATRTIRSSQHPEAATIPIIAMTADAFAENVAESHAAGMNAHISKPIDLPLLFKTLGDYIKKK